MKFHPNLLMSIVRWAKRRGSLLFTNYIFITYAALVEEQGEFGWIMSTAIVIALDYHSAVILDGESFVLVVTVKMLLCNVPASLFLLLPVSY